MPSDFPALDLALDARGVVDSFLFELLSEGFLLFPACITAVLSRHRSPRHYTICPRRKA